jgi:hypothetical protein
MKKAANIVLALVLTPLLFAWVVGLFVPFQLAMELAAIVGLGYAIYALVK